METKQELLKQLSEAQCQLEELKKKIENYQEPKFEVGKWYKGGTYLICPTDLTNIHNAIGYGFTHGCWADFKHFSMEGIHKMIPATKEEVEEALIKEAKRRGFDVTCKIIGIKSAAKDKVCSLGKTDRFKFHQEENELDHVCKNVSYTIFKDGKWAEIIKEEKIEIGGYEVKPCTVTGVGRGTSYGTDIDGNFFSWEFWQAAKLISEHSKAKIMVGCSKQFDVSLETIEKILKLKNK